MWFIGLAENVDICERKYIDENSISVECEIASTSVLRSLRYLIT